MRWMTLLLLSGTLSFAEPEPPMPMRFDPGDSAAYRWLNKDVLESRPLDSMEDLNHWELRGKGEMTLDGDRFHDGKHSVRLVVKSMTPEDQPAENKRNFGEVYITRRFDGEDWSRYNRISFWVYSDLPGWKVAHTRIRLLNEGKVKVPGGFYPVYHLAILKNGEWNRVVWELGDLPRDRVVGVQFFRRRQGSEPGASETMTFYFDELALERVNGDYIEGWGVWPGRIAFSHTGYQIGAPKQALATDLAADEFRLIDQETGQVAFTKPVEEAETRIGKFQVMDFTEFDTPGWYVIRAGDRVTRPFRVHADVWETTIWKAINFFYVERCGMEVPGVHRACHRDWLGIHGDRRIVINGGWHDAGDLSQGLVNTSESVYAMLDLAEALKASGHNPRLARSLIEEAKWGLDWVLKSRFGDGFRVVWATMGFWSNGIIGDADDVTAQAINGPMENFCASAAEAIAYRVLQNDDPDLAAHCLRTAQSDWEFGTAGPQGRQRGGRPLEVFSYGALASLELYRATGEQRYADKAIEMARQILDSQQRDYLPGLEAPITGFFYTSPEKKQFSHYLHRSHEQAPVVALARLCDEFPEHPDWIRWYAAVVLHSEFFQKEMSKLTAPYHMLPNSLRTPKEANDVEERHRDAYRQQVLNGFKVGGHHYVRVYPVQPQGAFRGNYGTMLSQAKAVSAAARLRRNAELAALTQRQLQWVVGLNPFAQSTMYGEGYDYTPQYSAMSGDIAGSLPVGIKSKENYDVPYWPVHNYPNYKEVWVHPVARWFWLMSDVAVPQTVAGRKLKFAVSQQSDSNGEIGIELRAQGRGAHRFTIRADNASFPPQEKELVLTAGNEGTLTWQGRVIAPNAPWVAVIIADGDLSQREEVVGVNWGRRH